MGTRPKIIPTTCGFRRLATPMYLHISWFIIVYSPLKWSNDWTNMDQSISLRPRGLEQPEISHFEHQDLGHLCLHPAARASRWGMHQWERGFGHGICSGLGISSVVPLFFFSRGVLGESNTLSWLHLHIHIICGAPKIAKLAYNSNNYGLWYL